PPPPEGWMHAKPPLQGQGWPAWPVPSGRQAVTPVPSASWQVVPAAVQLEGLSASQVFTGTQIMAPVGISLPAPVNTSFSRRCGGAPPQPVQSPPQQSLTQAPATQRWPATQSPNWVQAPPAGTVPALVQAGTEAIPTTEGRQDAVAPEQPMPVW